jgi:quercetin dioxygenase-like cupin family protein
MKRFREEKGTYRWDDISLLAYKEEGTHFKSITRQILFGEEQGLASQLRYFEIAAGGHSTLERHQHEHAVMILRGKGEALVGDQIVKLNPFDLVHVPPMTWHQFQASLGQPLGFLCMVDCERDRPERPNEDSLKEIRQKPDVAKFIRV